MRKRILYITTTLPSLTLTFVYREIEALSKAGYEIETVSMGTPLRTQISYEAIKVYESTHYLDKVSLFRKIFSQFHVFLCKPCEWTRLLFLSLREKEIKRFRDRIRILYHFLEAGYLFTQLKEYGLSHIHAHFLTGPTSIALFLSRYLKIPFSFTMHASLIFVDPLMLLSKLRMCKKAVTISEYNKKYLLAKYGIEFSDKIKIIHCGIDLSGFEPVDNAKEIPPLILAVGQMARRKGFRYLVNACGLLKKKGVPFRCIIVGDGEEMNTLTEIIRENKMDEVVSLVGRQPQERVKILLQKTSIFVLPSIVTETGEREGIPVALMEAMAMKIPVVSTKTVGIPELIDHGVEGLLVEQKDPEELASVLDLLLRDPKNRGEMGARGRKKIAQQFNIEHIPELFDTIFN